MEACAKEKAEGFDEVKFLWDAAPKCGWTAIQWFDKTRNRAKRKAKPGSSKHVSGAIEKQLCTWDCYFKFVDCQIILIYISIY